MRIPSAVAVLVGAAVAAVAAGARLQDPVYRARADIVAIDVSVMNGRSPVLNLTAADFELRDNGVLQSILDFGRERQPLDVTLTIDVSGSMTPARRLIVQRAVDEVSRALGAADRGALVSFARGSARRTPLTAPPLSLDLSPVSSDSMSGTAIIDALLLSLVSAPSPDRRQLTLFMTDGEDNASYFDMNTVVETVKHASGQLSVVLARENRGLADGRIMDLFRLVARTTGGELVELGRNDDLGKAFIAALESFRTSYVLRYAPAGVAAAGWHEVAVRLKSGRNVTIRARRGYWSDPLR